MTTLRFLLEVSTTDDSWVPADPARDLLEHLQMVGPDGEPVWLDTFDRAAALERVPGHDAQGWVPGGAMPDPVYWECNAHGESLSCCADAPDVYRVAQP